MNAGRRENVMEDISVYFFSFLLFLFPSKITQGIPDNYLQIYDKARNAVALALSPVVRALVDPDGALREIRDLDSVIDQLSFVAKCHIPCMIGTVNSWHCCSCFIF